MEDKTAKTIFSACSRALWRPRRVVIPYFIRNSQAVLLLAACRNAKSDRLLVYSTAEVDAGAALAMGLASVVVPDI